MDTSKVIVYILTGDPNSPQVQKLWKCFSNPLFDRNKVYIEDPDPAVSSMNPSDLEYYRVKMALENAAAQYPHNPLILIKDTSVSGHNCDYIAEYVREALKDQNWNIFYLTKWQDRCDLHQPKGMVNTTGINQSFSPQGFQAVMLTPQTRDILLKKTAMKNGSLFSMDKNLSQTLQDLIAKKSLVSYCASPNIFNFDPTLAKSEADMLKLKECADPLNYAETGTSSNVWIWLIILIFIILVVAMFAKGKRM